MFGGLPVGRIKGDRIVKERQTKSRGGVKVSGSKSRISRKRRDPDTVMQPNNARDGLVGTEIFSKIPEP